NRRENWWYYSQSGPGIYQGDVQFYSNDWDARADLRRIDTNRCRVALLTGEYDYSCTPAMAEAVAGEIPGARFTVMSGIGHFPMVENYPAFRGFLLAELEQMLGWSELFAGPDRLGRAGALGIDRDRLPLLPLEDDERRVDPPALFVELEV